MPLWMTAALMLIIAVLSGLTVKCIEPRIPSRAGLLIFLCAVLLVSLRDIVIMPELTVNFGVVLTFAFASHILIRKKVSVKSAALALVFSAVLAAIGLMAEWRLSSDAAVLLTAAASVLMYPVFKSFAPILFICASGPVFGALIGMSASCLNYGYAYFELDSSILDIQLMSLLFNIVVIELLDYRRKLAPVSRLQ